MPKPGEPKKPEKNVAKPAAKPAPTKAVKNAAGKPPQKPAPKAAKKPGVGKNDYTESTGRDHPSQSEHSAQAEKMRALYEKLHGTAEQRANIPGQGVPGKKKGGFDANQLRGHQKSFGGAANMIRRTQSRGGGSGGGGGGGGGSAA